MLKIDLPPELDFSGLNKADLLDVVRLGLEAKRKELEAQQKTHPRGRPVAGASGQSTTGNRDDHH